MGPLSSDISKVVKKTPGHIPYGRRGLSAEDGKEGWRLQGPGSPTTFGGSGDPADFRKHYFTDKEDWGSVAKDAGYSDPLELIRLNFETTDSREVNWFLQHYCGCNRSRDKLNFSFSNSAAVPKGGGFVWVPVEKGLPYPPKPTSKKVDCSIVAMSRKDIIRHKFTKASLRLSGGGLAKVGMLVPTAEGDRLLLSVSAATVVFTIISTTDKAHRSKVGKLFMQTSVPCAQSDLAWGWGKKVGDSGKWLQKAALFEVDLVVGMMTGGLSAGFEIVKAATDGGLDQAVAFAKALNVIHKELKNINSVSPELHDLLLRAFFSTFKKEFRKADGEAVWKLAGTLISDFGGDVLQGRLDTTKLFAKSLKVVHDAAIDKAAKALDKAVEDYKRNVPGMVLGFVAAGVTLTMEQAETIGEEIQKDPRKIKRSLEKITKAVDGIKLKYRKSK